MRRKKWFIGLLIAAVLVFGSTMVHAVPSLGVGTGSFDCTGATAYWQCFSGNLGSNNGFALPASGGTVTPFIEFEVGWNPAAISLLAEPSIGNFTFTTADGHIYNSSTVPTSGAISTYDSPYQGVDVLDAPWAFDNPLQKSTTLAMLTGTLTYTGKDVTGDYLFLVADGNGMPGLQGMGPVPDSFSVPGMSAVGVNNGNDSSQVPEPGTLLLLGAGLLGLPLFARKMKTA